MLVITAVIPARAGSKRVPMKNIRSLGGKPLIDWSISSAVESSQIAQVLVSTDDVAIVANSSFLSGAKKKFENAEIGTVLEIQAKLLIHKRSLSTSADRSKTITVIEEIDRDFKDLGEDILLLQPTSPFRGSDEISALVDFKKITFSESVFSVSQASSPHPLKSFKINSENKVSGDVTIFEILRTPEQELPILYTPDGAYYFSEKISLLRDRKFVTEKSRCFIRNGFNTVNIDSEEDLIFAQFLLDQKLIRL